MLILVIGADDDRVAWVEWTLLDEDVDLRLASHGEEGIAIAKSFAFEFIILDPHLPDLSGPGMLKRFAEGGAGAPSSSSRTRLASRTCRAASDLGRTRT